jgi:hypothetical protein
MMSCEGLGTSGYTGGYPSCISGMVLMADSTGLLDGHRRDG